MCPSTGPEIRLCLLPHSPVDGKGGCPPRRCLSPPARRTQQPWALLAAAVLLRCGRTLCDPTDGLATFPWTLKHGLLEPQVHDLGRVSTRAPQMGLREDRISLREGELLRPSRGRGHSGGPGDRPGPGGPLQPEFPHTRHGQLQRRDACAPGCVTAGGRSGPPPPAQPPSCLMLHLRSCETSCAPPRGLNGRREGAGGGRAMEKKREAFFGAHRLKRFKRAQCGIHRETLSSHQMGESTRADGRGARAGGRGARPVCGRFHCKLDTGRNEGVC